jgi:hypothetical protein
MNLLLAVETEVASRAFSIRSGGFPFWLNDNSPVCLANYEATTRAFYLENLQEFGKLIKSGPLTAPFA